MAESRLIVWTPRAGRHIDLIFEHVARDSPAGAERLTTGIAERVLRLDQFSGTRPAGS